MCQRLCERILPAVIDRSCYNKVANGPLMAQRFARPAEFVRAFNRNKPMASPFCRRFALGSSFVLCCALANMLTVVGPTKDAAAATQQDDYWCWKVGPICDGVSSGTCQPQGIVCLSGTCGDTDDCWFRYDWECIESCGDTCVVDWFDEWNTNCEPKCKLVFYNQCACTCQSLGQGFEGGPYERCN